MKKLIAALAGTGLASMGCGIFIVLSALWVAISTAVWSLIVWAVWTVLFSAEMVTMEPELMPVIAIAFLSSILVRTVRGRQYDRNPRG
jgi:hypothetical protein